MTAEAILRQRSTVQSVVEFVRFAKDPLCGFVTARKNWGDIVVLPVPGPRVVQFTNPEHIVQILKIRNRDRLGTHSLRDLLGGGLLTNENQDQAWRRKIVMRPLTQQSIALYVDQINTISNTWLAGVKDDAVMDLTREMFALSLNVLVETVFGSKISINTTELADLLEQYMYQYYLDNSGWRKLLPLSIETPGRRKRREAVAGMKNLIADCIGQRDGGPADNDLLFTLLHATDEQGNHLNREDIRDEILTLILSGHETPALMISYAAWQLSLNPVIQDNLRRELTSVLGTGAADLESIGKLPYLRAVVSEILRLYPPAYIIGREADKDFTVNGFQVKSGDQLVVPQWVVHRDDRWWHRPDEFRPERWFNGEVDQLPRGAYFPFGGGKRSCIGNHFAELTGQLVLATIVRGIEFSPVSDFKLKFIQGPTLRPKNGIPVVCRKLSDGNHV